MKLTLEISEDTLQAIEKFTEHQVDGYKAGQLSHKEYDYGQGLAVEVLTGMLRSNPDIFRYTAAMKKVRDGFTIILDGKEKIAYLE